MEEAFIARTVAGVLRSEYAAHALRIARIQRDFATGSQKERWSMIVELLGDHEEAKK